MASQGARPTKRERRDEARRKREEVLRRRRRRERTRRILTLAAILVVVVVAGVLVVNAQRAKGTGDAPAGTKTFTVASRNHVQGTVKYPQDPPVGGDHAPQWLNCGFYSQPQTTENVVHELEHGAVWITYRPGLPSSQVDILRRLATGQTFVTVTPYPGLPAAVVASAWGKQLRLSSASDPRLQKFVTAFRQGPQTPELGAPCTGGIGQPEA